MKDSWCYYDYMDSPLQSWFGESWWNAQGKCRSLTWRSSLAYPDSTSWSSYQSVRSVFCLVMHLRCKNFKRSTFRNYKGNNNKELWLGCMYNSTMNKYYFTTGSQVSWTPGGAPNFGNNYCYTDNKNSYQWRTDSSSSTLRAYICQMNAIPKIVQSELSLQVSATGKSSLTLIFCGHQSFA